jgi:hypothetical protein
MSYLVSDQKGFPEYGKPFLNYKIPLQKGAETPGIYFREFYPRHK